MQIVLSVPRGWAKVSIAAKAAKVPVSHANSLIISGTVPVAIDGAGYMWVSVDSLRNGFSSGKQSL
jgi:hypothetical protein